MHDFRCWSEKKVGFNCLYFWVYPNSIAPITAPPSNQAPGPHADLPHAACRRGREGLGPWACWRSASCGYGGGGSQLGGFWVLACSCAGALRSRCAHAALARRSRCDAHTPAFGEPEPWAVHDDAGSSPSSSLPSCCHCAIIIHANSRARALALARALSLARDHVLATLALCSHSRPCLVAP